jgi:hypothetical protein
VLLKNSRSSGRSNSFCALDRSTAVEASYCLGAIGGRNCTRVFSTRDESPEFMVEAPQYCHIECKLVNVCSEWIQSPLTQYTISPREVLCGVVCRPAVLVLRLTGSCIRAYLLRKGYRTGKLFPAQLCKSTAVKAEKRQGISRVNRASTQPSLSVPMTCIMPASTCTHSSQSQC